MTPQHFIAKWKNVELTERSASQSHFIDLCRILDEPAPTDVDPTGEWYAFEKGALKTGGGDGWADVWKRGHFAWEYKRRDGNLDTAYTQLQRYAVALESPPLLIVADTQRIRIHSNWTNTVHQTTELQLHELADERRRRILKWAFAEPDHLKPGQTRAEVTEDIARKFGDLARAIRERRKSADPQVVAHFMNRLVFCMFADWVGLLPKGIFRRMIQASVTTPDRFIENAKLLFGAMRSGGSVGFEPVEWFNGGIFDDDDVLPLTRDDMKIIAEAAERDWSNIDPSIMGTLFERGLDPDKRSQTGAHYTDREKIELIVRPVIVEPLTEEWREIKDRIAALMDRSLAHKDRSQKTRLFNEAQKLHKGFVERLTTFRVLDPACGSGNFLYVSLLALKDLEHRVNLDAEALGLPRGFPTVGPECANGIEINPFAAELARVSVWVGEIQWMQRNGFDVSRQPILKPLDTIECRDSLLNKDGSEAPWPPADVIIGNPPFLGGKLLRGTLGDDVVNQLFEVFDGRVPAEADLVCYWFAKAREMIDGRAAVRAGLVTTNSIRGGTNRELLNDIADNGRIFDAWSDEPWVIEGASVRVSLVCFDSDDSDQGLHLNGNLVDRINTDLTSSGTNLTRASRLRENFGVAFMGDTKGGAFDISGEQARQWLTLPKNPNGRPNSQVLRPWINGMDITRRPNGKWIIDFGWTMTEHEAALFEAPFAFCLEHVKDHRRATQRTAYTINWWRHTRPRPDMWTALTKRTRYIVTPTLAKHRIFAWCSAQICPDHQLIVTARDDDTTFGILHSRMHEIWSLRLGTSLEDRPRYTPSTTFETFPFPEGLTPNIPAVDYAKTTSSVDIAAAAKRLTDLRDAWLNPNDLVKRTPEVVAGFPDRVLPLDAKAAKELKSRTLTKLYNARPAWLTNAHRDLDSAVASAYGWPANISDDQIIDRLFKLNQDRAATQK